MSQQIYPDPTVYLFLLKYAIVFVAISLIEKRLVTM
ncbi:MAG: hypothetical protein Hyperionvirus53_1 [Hyperionvirus sp.]|uniref:Uncharacterized protein n=1 Tax=Hyperionvirus sp. TaxID=2487770 RepID=A0A3G5ACG6_9VIRU|nr:MAG: hypothetical protein Hyperionvirus53_1 [Hyperionvirus sp.]